MNRDPEQEFEKVLLQIPLVDRRRIREAWSTLARGKPLILVDSKENLAKAGATLPASTSGGGYYFRREIFEEATEEILHAIIAHELAHTAVVLEEIKDKVENSYKRHSEELCSRDGMFEVQAARIRRLEDGTNRRAEDWGFPRAKADAWFLKRFEADLRGADPGATPRLP